MGPLSGIRVLDFTRVVAGPLAARILADQGAEVIKIEPPDGDLSRTFPPLSDDGITPYFAQQNAGKHFCSIDLAASGAPDLIIDLLASADVLIENFRPGVMARYGLGPTEMCERFPSLTYCSITGFGQTGPWADRRAYAPIGHLESGLLDYDQRKNHRPPKQPAIVLGDAVTAMMAANSINALLVQAARTGRGGHLDVCMVESMVYIQEWVSTELAGGWETTNAGSCQESPMLSLPNGETWGLGGSPVAWFEPIANAMGRQDLLTDPRFADPLDREANKEELFQLISEWAASFDGFDEFRAALEATSPFTVARLRTIDELAATDWSAERDLLTTTSKGGFHIPSRSARGVDIGTNGYVASRGADNASVMRELFDLDEATIAGLVDAGVLVAD